MTIRNISRCANPFARRVRNYLKNRRGSIAPLVALLIVPLVAIMGVATEGGSWFLIQRAAQNAADSAVIAAATNGGNGGTDFSAEAKSVASNYGFADGTNNTTVTVPAPGNYPVTSCTSKNFCYRVTVTHNVPLYLLQVIGYSGDTTVNSGAGQSISATSLATTKVIDAPFCLSALGSGDAITAHGVPKSTIGCNIQSNGNASCSGHSLTSGYSDATGKTNDCGSKQHTVSPISDPYASLASNIPSHSCSSGNSWEPAKKKDPALSNNNKWSTNSLPANPVCGDYQLQNDITISDGGTLVIANGSLDLNGHTLTGDGLTIILTGTSPSGHAQIIEGGGTLDISSPTSGTWSGMAVYQDPAVAEQTINYAGNSPTWKISGIVYLPKTDFTASGAVSKSSVGLSCFTLVVNTILINGTGDLFYTNPQSQCAQQGVSSPTNAAYVIGQLVY